ncbi:MAG: carboxypeptidase regulatory-like domain-containing protein [Elusimicrobia bacterium]|nr:carboxypeptidase regulatory-like domain-containing protein [Elusimicrobiota bacterium]
MMYSIHCQSFPRKRTKILFSAAFFLFPVSVFAAGELIGWQTMDQGGAARASSNYKANDSCAWAAVEKSQSANYKIQSGFVSDFWAAAESPVTESPVVVSTGIISGKITQSDGVTAISGALVEALQSGTIKLSAAADALGNYSLNVNVGTYDIRVSMTGYQTQTKTGVSVSANQTTTVNAALLAASEEKPQKEYKTTIGDNLFNPAAGGSSKVKFSLARSGHVTIKIYDLMGREIKTLVDEDRTAGEYQKDWDGRNDFGEIVPLGVYFLHYVYPGGHETRKIGVMWQ